jgi:hypothetical protein
MRGLGTSPYERVVNALDELEHEFTQHIADPGLQLEVKRRAAEARLLAAVGAKRGFSGCRKEFARLEAIGFSDIVRRIECSVLLASVCAGQEDAAAMKTILQALRQEMIAGGNERHGDGLKSLNAALDGISTRWPA